MHPLDDHPWYVPSECIEIDEEQYYALLKAYTGIGNGRSDVGSVSAAHVRNDDMALENLLAENTAAIKELTAALKAGGGKPAAATTDKPSGAARPGATKPKHSQAEMQAAVNEVKEAKGTAAAKAIITEVGGVATMKEITEAKYDAVYDAAKKALEPDEEGDGL